MRVGTIYARVRDGLPPMAESEHWYVVPGTDGAAVVKQGKELKDGVPAGALKFRSKVGAEFVARKENKAYGRSR